MKRYICTICQSQYRHRNSAQDHYNYVHRNVQHVCRTCFKVCGRRKKYYCHRRSCGGIYDKPIKISFLNGRPNIIVNPNLFDYAVQEWDVA